MGKVPIGVVDVLVVLSFGFGSLSLCLFSHCSCLIDRFLGGGRCSIYSFFSFVGLIC